MSAYSAPNASPYEDLAYAVSAVRPWQGLIVDSLLTAVETDGVVGGGEHYPLVALPACRLVQVIGAHNVRAVDDLPTILDRAAAEMDDPVDPGDHPLDLRQVGQIGRDERLVGRQIVRCHHVAQPQGGIHAAQQPAQAGADVRPRQ